MPLISSLVCLLIAARLGGEILERLGQPAMIGEILAGVLLGPSVAGWIGVTPELKVITELGVFFLVLLAGMEIDPGELAETMKGRGFWIALSSFLVPLLAGAAVAAAFGLDKYRVAFLGLCVAITALPVSVRILLDLGRLQSPTGRRIVSAAVFNDTAALLLLGIILDMGAAGTWSQLASETALALGKALLLMAVLVAAYRLIMLSAGRIPLARRVLERLLAGVKTKEALFAVSIAFVMTFAALSERLGLHSVIGAFFGAMLLSREFLGEENHKEVQKTASSVTIGFLAPVFFAAIGLQFDVRSLKTPGFLLAVLAAAFVSKIAGGYLGGRLARLSSAESWALGMGLNGRGIMELVIADIAYSRGFIGANIFTCLVLIAVTTTIVTPWLLKSALDKIPA
ncbi:MAG: cation:proton antiporter [Elusimicrobia bacterium]|nr:cation:proton antiporter [Elusimicrobiota bacterium]